MSRGYRNPIYVHTVKDDPEIIMDDPPQALYVLGIRHIVNPNELPLSMLNALNSLDEKRIREGRTDKLVAAYYTVPWPGKYYYYLIYADDEKYHYAGGWVRIRNRKGEK
jgi:hypothetical protein